MTIAWDRNIFCGLNNHQMHGTKKLCVVSLFLIFGFTVNWYIFTTQIDPDMMALNPYIKPPTKLQSKNDVNIKFYSQEGQDKAVYDIFPIENGFFIEMGAFDGQFLSNTLWLEKQHGWSGLLIEANPDLCKQIDKRHRNAWRLCACIADESKSIFIKMSEKDSALGGLKDSYTGHVGKERMKSKITVPCFKLQTVLRYVKKKRINYFSLDVEGAEMLVLKTIKDALKSRDIVVDVWTIEYAIHNGSGNEHSLKLKELRNYFKDVGGYTEHSTEGGLDVIFVYIETWCKTHRVLPNGQNCGT